LPTPGPLLAAGVLVAAVLAAGALAVVLELPDELELLPHAVNPTASIVNIPIGTTFFHQTLPRIRSASYLYVFLSKL
jgi:hypothetical protein